MIRKKKEHKKKSKIKFYEPDSLDIIENLKELHEKYIKLFIDLYTHASLVDDEFYVAAQETLTQQYKAELALLCVQSRVKTNEKFYLASEKAERLSIYQKLRWFKWRSSPMKQVLDQRINAEVGGYLHDLLFGVEPPPEYEDTEESEDQAEEATEPDEQPEELKMELVPQSGEIQPPEQTEPPAPPPSGMVGNITYYKFSDKRGTVMYCSVNLAADNITLEKLQEILHAETLEEVSKAEYDAQSEDEPEEEYDELDELYELEAGEENENSETALSTEVKPSDDDEGAE